MIPSLSQEELTQYASDAQTIQQPQGTDYTQGVKAGRTIPAKWWNWLFSASTKRIAQARSDADNMLTELKNVVTDAGLTPTASDNTQLQQAVAVKTSGQIDEYVLNKRHFMKDWADAELYYKGHRLIHKSTDNYNMYPELRYLKECNGVYFAEIHGSYADENTFVSAYACSTDLVHWIPASGEADGNNGLDRRCDTIYFNGAWFTVWNPSSYGNGKVYKSVNHNDWERVGADTDFGGYLCVAGTTLYNIYISGNSTPFSAHYRSTQDGTNWSARTTLTASLLGTSMTLINNRAHVLVSEAIALGSQKFLAGDFYILDLSNNTLGILNPYAQPSRMVKFHGDFYITVGTSNTTPWTYKISSTGQISTPSFSIDSWSSTADLLFTWDTTSGTKSFSADGTTFQNLPDFSSLFEAGITYTVQNVLYAQNFWFIGLTLSNNTFAVIKAASLTASLADYSVIYSGNIQVVNGIGNYTSNSLCKVTEPVAGIIAAYGAFSRNGGTSWIAETATTALEVTAVSVSSLIKHDKKFYGGWDTYAYAFYEGRPRYRLTTSEDVNNVIGHTLYLH